jgi:chromosome segregation ATPase
MTHDRTHYRALPVRLLIEQARYSGDELAIALGERLEEYDTDEATIADLLEDNKELEERNARLLAQIADLQAEIDTRLNWSN